MYWYYIVLFVLFVAGAGYAIYRYGKGQATEALKRGVEKAKELREPKK